MSRHDDAWKALVGAVWERIDEWRKRIVVETGLPFGRTRALRRLVDGPLSLSDLAVAMDVDRPAATVAVDDLEERGLVQRTPHPTNGRMKLVALTAAGKRMVARMVAMYDDPPPGFTELSAADVTAVMRVAAAITRPPSRT